MKIRDEISRLFWISRSFLAKIEFKSVSFFAMKRGKWVIKFKSTVNSDPWVTLTNFTARST